jgi:hypothetical protein
MIQKLRIEGIAAALENESPFVLWSAAGTVRKHAHNMGINSLLEILFRNRLCSLYQQCWSLRHCPFILKHRVGTRNIVPSLMWRLLVGDGTVLLLAVFPTFRKSLLCLSSGRSDAQWPLPLLVVQGLFYQSAERFFPSWG